MVTGEGNGEKDSDQGRRDRNDFEKRDESYTNVGLKNKKKSNNDCFSCFLDKMF